MRADKCATVVASYFSNGDGDWTRCCVHAMNAVMSKTISRHRIDVDRYYALARDGFFAPDARTELIDGDIVHMPPIGSFHAAVVSSLTEALCIALRGQARVSIQAPVRLDHFSEPQPDLMVLRAREDDYRRAHPLPAEVLLLIEVSDSTLWSDRNVKVPLYAQNEIPEVWLVDIQGRQLHVFRSLGQGRYAEAFVIDRNDRASPSLLSGVVESRSSVTPSSRRAIAGVRPGLFSPRHRAGRGSLVPILA